MNDKKVLKLKNSDVKLNDIPKLNNAGEKSLKEYTYVVTFGNGKRKIIVTHTVSGIDKRKEAADVILKNIK